MYTSTLIQFHGDCRWMKGMMLKGIRIQSGGPFANKLKVCDEAPHVCVFFCEFTTRTVGNTDFCLWWKTIRKNFWTFGRAFLLYLLSLIKKHACNTFSNFYCVFHETRFFKTICGRISTIVNTIVFPLEFSGDTRRRFLIS